MSTQTFDVRRAGRPAVWPAAAGCAFSVGGPRNAGPDAGPGGRTSPGLTVISVAADGTETTLTDYRWLVELDKTYPRPDPRRRLG